MDGWTHERVIRALEQERDALHAALWRVLQRVRVAPPADAMPSRAELLDVAHLWLGDDPDAFGAVGVALVHSRDPELVKRKHEAVRTLMESEGTAWARDWVVELQGREGQLLTMPWDEIADYNAPGVNLFMSIAASVKTPLVPWKDLRIGGKPMTMRYSDRWTAPDWITAVMVQRDDGAEVAFTPSRWPEAVR